jgi:zinc protease
MIRPSSLRALLLALLVAPAPALAQDAADRTQPPAPGEPRPYTLPEVVTTTLPNGLEVVLVDRPDFPTLSLRLGIRAGSDSTGGVPALSDMTARMVREGTDGMDADAIARLIDQNGISYSAQAGTNVTTVAVDGLSTQLDTMLTLLGEVVLQPTFPEDRFRARQQELMGELQLREAQPDFHRSRLTSRVLFADHPYGAIVDSAGVQSLDADALRAFHARTWTAGRSRLVVVGRLPADVQDRIAATFGTWAAGEEAWAVEAPAPIRFCNEAHVVVRPNSAQTAITWVGAAPGPLDPAWLGASVASNVLGGGIIGRLFLNLREEKSFTYGAYSGLRDLAHTAWFSASSNVRGDVTGEALEAFLDEFRRIAGEPLPEGDLADSVGYLSGVFPIELSRNAAVAGRMLSLYLQGHDAAAWLESWRARLSQLSLEQADAAARALVDPDRLLLVMVGESEAVRPAAQAVSSRVYVYDLQGDLVETLDGERPSTCPAE